MVMQRGHLFDLLLGVRVERGRQLLLIRHLIVRLILLLIMLMLLVAVVVIVVTIGAVLSLQLLEIKLRWHGLHGWHARLLMLLLLLLMLLIHHHHHDHIGRHVGVRRGRCLLLLLRISGRSHLLSSGQRHYMVEVVGREELRVD